MKIVRLTFLFLLIHLNTFSQWSFVGSEGFSSHESNFIFVAVNPISQQPYIVFRDIHHYSKASVMNFNGTSWVYVGIAGFSDGDVSCTSLAFSDSGVPFVAYMDRSNGYKTTVMKFDGSSWISVGNKGFGSAGSFQSITIDSQGLPYVAFRDKQNGYKASVMKFDGTTWNYLGMAGFSTPGPNPFGAAFITLTLDHNDVPYIAYSDDVNDGKATVQKFNGTTWEFLGSPGFAGYNSQYAKSIAIDSQNRPYVVCQEAGKVTVKRFEDGNWQNVGNPSFSQGGAEYACIAIDKFDMPYVAFQDYGVTRKASVMKYDGTSWNYIGEQGFSPSSVIYTTIDIDNEGNAYVAFSDNNTPHWNASVMKFENHVIDLKEEQLNTNFNVYPNPSGNVFTVSYKGDPSNVTINVKNQLGQLISSKVITSQNEFKETFNLSTHGRGIYFIELISNKSRDVQKIVIE
jgi:hypothetical protein